MKTLFGIILTAAAINLAAVAQTNTIMTTNKIETATLGGGCFWCVEAVYERLPGVLTVTSGYAGGHVANPTYHDVCKHDRSCYSTFDLNNSACQRDRSRCLYAVCNHQ